MTIGHLFRLYESRSGKFIGEYDTREEAEAVAADTVPKTVITTVRFKKEDYPPYSPRNPDPGSRWGRKPLKHPIDLDVPRDPTFWCDPMRGVHPEDHQQAYRNLLPLAILPGMPFVLIVIGFLVLYFLSSHNLL
jgi:hypothetical protein